MATGMIYCHPILTYGNPVLKQTSRRPRGLCFCRDGLSYVKLQLQTNGWVSEKCEGIVVWLAAWHNCSYCIILFSIIMPGGLRSLWCFQSNYFISQWRSSWLPLFVHASRRFRPFLLVIGNPDISRLLFCVPWALTMLIKCFPKFGWWAGAVSVRPALRLALTTSSTGWSISHRTRPSQPGSWLKRLEKLEDQSNEGTGWGGLHTRICFSWLIGYIPWCGLLIVYVNWFHFEMFPGCWNWFAHVCPCWKLVDGDIVFDRRQNLTEPPNSGQSAYPLVI